MSSLRTCTRAWQVSWCLQPTNHQQDWQTEVCCFQACVLVAVLCGALPHAHLPAVPHPCICSCAAAMDDLMAQRDAGLLDSVSSPHPLSRKASNKVLRPGANGAGKGPSAASGAPNEAVMVSAQLHQRQRRELRQHAACKASGMVRSTRLPSLSPVVGAATRMHRGSVWLCWLRAEAAGAAAQGRAGGRCQRGGGAGLAAHRRQDDAHPGGRGGVQGAHGAVLWLTGRTRPGQLVLGCIVGGWLMSVTCPRLSTTAASIHQVLAHAV